MAKVERFEDLEIWQLSREICKDVWSIIQNSSLQKDYKLREQINGSSGSIMDNIAEGFGRGGNKEFINFLSYSRGSCCETESQLQRTLDRKHISQEEYDSLLKKTQNEIDQISKLMNYLKNSERKGPKFD